MKDKQLIPKRKKVLKTLKLESMFDQQKKFQKAIVKDFALLDDEAFTNYTQLMLHCIHAESVEALNWLNWKPWKKKKLKFNRYEFLNELVDIQHFLINCALATKCDAKEFSELFFNKGKENLNRQRRNY